MTIKTFTTTLLLATSFLLLTACNDNAKTETNTTTVVSPTSLTLTIDKTSLNKDENTTVKVMATYRDNSTKEVTDKVEWIVVPSDAVKMTNTTLTAVQNNPTTLKAKLNSTLSNEINLAITWTVNGHRLPPQPDKALNDSTLLGIDVNDNGVRDDVERWIYEEYKDKHPIYVDIAMQAARGYKLVLETPERAKEIHGEATAYLDCESYYKTYAKYFNEPILVKENVVGEYFRKTIYFNTKDRMDAYGQYDILLSGDSYSLPKIEDLKSLCDFNTSKYEE